jgi:chromosome partitioning protein
MHSIGVANQKGGVGKTTTAINIAAGLALQGRRTLLVDMDPQGNASSGVGVDRDGIEHTIHEALMGACPIDAALCDTAVEGLSLIPSDIRLIAAERELLNIDSRETRLHGCLQPLNSRYDFVVIDAPPSLGLLTLNVMRAVEHLIIPVQAEYYALEGLSMLLETIEQIQGTINPRLKVLGVLMTMVDGRTLLAKQVVTEVLNHFGDKVFKTIITRSVRLSEAPSHGLPIMLYDPKSAPAEAHQRLTEEVIARCEQPTSLAAVGQNEEIQSSITGGNDHVGDQA